MLWIFAFLIILPVAELTLIIWIGNSEGVWFTVLAIFAPALGGMLLVKRQGIELSKSVQHEINAGRIPTDHVLRGFCLFIAAVFLITPGFITDAAGFLMLVPFFRHIAATAVIKRFNATVSFNQGNMDRDADDVIDGAFVDITDSHSLTQEVKPSQSSEAKNSTS